MPRTSRLRDSSWACDRTPPYLCKRKPVGFFDLPRELRDIIYEFALVPKLPIEFAGLVPFQWDGDFWTELDDRGQGWYIERYQCEIARSLQLLRTSKRFCE